MKTFKKLVGERIKTARKKAKLSQNELAEKVDVERTRVSEWERGIHEPKGPKRERLLEVLGVKEDVIFAASDASMTAETSLAANLAPLAPQIYKPPNDAILVSKDLFELLNSGFLKLNQQLAAMTDLLKEYQRTQDNQALIDAVERAGREQKRMVEKILGIVVPKRSKY